MQLRRTMRNFGLALGVVAAGIINIPSTVKAQDIVAILTCPMGCGVMEGNTIFGTMIMPGPMPSRPARKPTATPMSR